MSKMANTSHFERSQHAERSWNSLRYSLVVSCCWCMALMISATTVAREPSSVSILFSADDDIFPKSWLRPRIAAGAEPLEADRHPAAERLLASALAKYPAEVLSENLRAVYVLRQLRFSGIRASGTNSRTRIYLSLGPKTRPYSEPWVERVFHSEFSSILLRNFDQQFPRSQWLAVNPSDFEYGSSGVDAVKNRQIGQLFEDQFLQDAFLGRYSQSSLENDLNAYAGHLLAGDHRLWQAAREYEGVARKLDLTVQFLSQIHPQFSKSYLRQLAGTVATAHPVEDPTPATRKEDLATKLREVVLQQARDWNRGDIDAYMQAYWQSPQLTFSSGGSTTRGWEETRQRYHRNYPNAQTMGKLTFSDLEVQPLTSGAALMLGTWHLQREQPVGGNFTLVWKQIDGTWQIVHDHTSVLEPSGVESND